MRRLKKELWPSQITLNVDDSKMEIDRVEAWLGENLGEFKGQWYAVYHHNKTDYYFRNSRDATLFALRWS